MIHDEMIRGVFKAYGEGYDKGFARGLEEGKKLETTAPTITPHVCKVPETISFTGMWYYCRQCKQISKKICFCTCTQKRGDLVWLDVSMLLEMESLVRCR